MSKRAAKYRSHRKNCAPFRLRGEVLEARRLLAFDPSAMEQAYLEDINRMRLDPQGELDVLFSSLSPLRARDPSVQSALQFFNVNGNLLLSQWSQLSSVPPLNWNEDLYDAATKHNLQMQRFDEQSHQLPGEKDLGDRVRDEGYEFRRLNENVFAFAEGHAQGHAGFVIDWGDGPGGIQDPPGHRNAIMNGSLTEVGIAVLADNDPSNAVGPNLVTQDFGQPRTAGNPYVLGVTWQDENSNGIYDLGEGIGNINIQVTGSNGTFATQSMTAGGYQVRVPDGVYQVTASGGSFGGGRVISNISVSGSNRKVDLQPDVGSQPPIANPDAFSTTEDVSVTYNVIANDRYANGNAVSGTVSVTTPPQSGTITEIATNGRVTYQPHNGFSGTDSFRYQVTDRQGITSNTTIVTIGVSRVNDAPTAQTFSVTTDQDTPLDIPLSNRVSDADGTIDWSTLDVTVPTQGTAVVDSTAQVIRYTPPPGYTGTAQLMYRVADNEGAVTPLTTITVNVVNVNDAPLAMDDIFATLVNQSQVLPVLQNDTDLDGDIGNATVVIAAAPHTGQAVAVSNTIQYNPASEFVGADTFSYYVVDPSGASSNTALVTVYVTSADSRWKNPVNSRDVNGDGTVAALDALQVINRVGTVLANSSFDAPPPFLDVDGNGIVAAMDALLVINQLISDGQNAPASSRIAANDLDVDQLDSKEAGLDRSTGIVESINRFGSVLTPPNADSLFAIPALRQPTLTGRAGSAGADDNDQDDEPSHRFRLAEIVFAEFARVV